MKAVRAVRIASYALAVCVLLAAGLLVGLLDFLPDVVVRAVAESGSVDDASPSATFLVGVPLGLAFSVVARAATRTPTDVVLGAFAVPSLLASSWALYSAHTVDSGVYWGGLFSITAGTLLAVALVADAVLGRLVSA